MSLTAKQIWTLPAEERLHAFIERWKELDEFTGNRTAAERAEMGEIAEAIVGRLILEYERRSIQ